MTTRDVTDADGTRWTCAQAYAGLAADSPAAEATSDGATVDVVCTPDGGAQTVRLALPPDWRTSVSDDDLAAQIAGARA